MKKIDILQNVLASIVGAMGGQPMMPPLGSPKEMTTEEMR